MRYEEWKKMMEDAGAEVPTVGSRLWTPTRVLGLVLGTQGAVLLVLSAGWQQGDLSSWLWGVLLVFVGLGLTTVRERDRR